MPLAGPGSRVIPPRWSEHHRPTATATMTGECVITRTTGGGTTDDDGTWTPAQPTTIYAGPCRFTALPQDEHIADVGAAQETRRRYQVSVRYDAPEIAIGDIVTMTLAADPGLVGQEVRVVDITYGSEQWQRDLICTEREA